MQQDILFKPKLWTTIKGYSLNLFFSDFFAGVTVAIIAFPVAIAFGIASGSTPEKGILAAIVGGFLVSFLGGSRVLIGGPTSPFLLITLRILQEEGALGLSVAMILAGLFLCVMGVGRLGKWIRYVPLPVIVGFRSGIAVGLFTSQLKDFLGLVPKSVPLNFIGQWVSYFQSIETINSWAVVISLLTLFVLLGFQKLLPKSPYLFVALFVATVVSFFFELPMETIGSRFGSFSLTFEIIPLNRATLTLIHQLLHPAFTLAIICALEALLTATIADGMIGGKHRPNTELIAQAVANIGSGLVGGIPVTGTLARTATNIRAGARTPMAGLIHSVVLFLLVFFLSSWIAQVPLASLSAILILIAYNMIEWKAFVEFYQTSKSEFIVLFTTFLATVFFDLAIAIQTGMTLSVFLFMKRMSEVSEIKKFQAEWIEEEDPDAYYEKDEIRKIEIPKDTDVFELNGAFFFGAASKFEEAFRQSLQIKKFIILRMSDILEIDATGLHILSNIAIEAKKNDKEVILTELKQNCEQQLEKTGVIDLFGKEAIHKDLKSALHYVQERRKR